MGRTCKKPNVFDSEVLLRGRTSICCGVKGVTHQICGSHTWHENCADSNGLSGIKSYVGNFWGKNKEKSKL